MESFTFERLGEACEGVYQSGETPDSNRALAASTAVLSIKGSRPCGRDKPPTFSITLIPPNQICLSGFWNDPCGE